MVIAPLAVPVESGVSVPIVIGFDSMTTVTAGQVVDEVVEVLGDPHGSQPLAVIVTVPPGGAEDGDTETPVGDVVDVVLETDVEVVPPVGELVLVLPVGPVVVVG